MVFEFCDKMGNFSGDFKSLFEAHVTFLLTKVPHILVFGLLACLNMVETQEYRPDELINSEEACLISRW